MKTGQLNYRVNHQIKSSEVRVIGAEGKQLGILKLSEALSKAREIELDLVEIAPNASPPVAKIVDLGKFRYQEEKRLQKQKRASKSGETKEVRFSPFIANHDYETRLGKIKEFLSENNKVRVVVVFMGRQMNSKPFGYKLIDRIKADLGDNIAVDMEPKFLGRHLVTIISPFKKVKK